MAGNSASSWGGNAVAAGWQGKAHGEPQRQHAEEILQGLAPHPSSCIAHQVLKAVGAKEGREELCCIHKVDVQCSGAVLVIPLAAGVAGQGMQPCQTTAGSLEG